MRNPLLRVVVICSAAIALPAMAHGQVVKKGSGYLFRIKFTKGQKLAYNVLMGLGPLGKANSGLTISVLSVKGGIATTKLNVEAVKMGQRTVIPAQSATQAFNNRMEVAQSKDSQSISQFKGAYPPQPIKIGGKWQTKLIMNAMSASTPIDTTYKFVGLKKVNGIQVAVLSMVLHGQYSGTGTTLLRVSDGTPQSVTMNLVLRMSADPTQAPEPFKVTFATTRR